MIYQKGVVMSIYIRDDEETSKSNTFSDSMKWRLISIGLPISRLQFSSTRVARKRIKDATRKETTALLHGMCVHRYIYLNVCETAMIQSHISEEKTTYSIQTKKKNKREAHTYTRWAITVATNIDISRH